MWSGITLAVSLPIIGWAADRLPPFTLLVGAFLIRGLLFLVML